MTLSSPNVRVKYSKRGNRIKLDDILPAMRSGGQDANQLRRGLIIPTDNESITLIPSLTADVDHNRVSLV